MRNKAKQVVVQCPKYKESLYQKQFAIFKTLIFTNIQILLINIPI